MIWTKTWTYGQIAFKENFTWKKQFLQAVTNKARSANVVPCVDWPNVHSGQMFAQIPIGIVPILSALFTVVIRWKLVHHFHDSSLQLINSLLVIAL